MPKLPTKTRAAAAGIGVGASRINVSGITPQAFGAGTAAAVGEFAGTVGQVAQDQLTRMMNTEVQESLVGHAKYRGEYSERLDAAAQNDEDLDKIKEEMQGKVAAISENFQTKAGRDAAEVHGANLDALFQNKSNTITVGRAKKKAELMGKQWMDDTFKNLTRNPTELPAYVQDAKEFSLTLGLPESQRKLAERSLIQNANMVAAMGAANTNPAKALSDLAMGDVYTLTSEQTETVKGHAHAAQGRIQTQLNLERATTDRAREKLQDEAYDEYVQAVRSPGGANLGALQVDTRFAGPGGGQKRQQLFNIADAHAKALRAGPALRTNPAVYNSIRKRIQLPYGHPQKITDRNEIWKLYGPDGGLIQSDAESLEKILVDARTPDGHTWAQAETEFLHSQSDKLDKSTLYSKDAGGGDRVHAFTIFVQQQIARFKENFPKADPYILFRPGKDNPLYLGHYAAQFNSPGNLEMQEMMDLAQGTNTVKKGSPPMGKPRRSLDDIAKGKK